MDLLKRGFPGGYEAPLPRRRAYPRVWAVLHIYSHVGQGLKKLFLPEAGSLSFSRVCPRPPFSLGNNPTKLPFLRVPTLLPILPPLVKKADSNSKFAKPPQVHNGQTPPLPLFPADPNSFSSMFPTLRTNDHGSFRNGIKGLKLTGQYMFEIYDSIVDCCG